MTIEPGGGERGSAGRGPQDVDLVRTMALSSAELWHEILERLREVQESQVRLAGAIETLGVMVRDALAPDSRPALGAHSQRTPLTETTGEPAAAPALSWAMPPTPSAPANEPAVAVTPTEERGAAIPTADSAGAPAQDTSSASTWAVVPDEPAPLFSDSARRPRHAIGAAPGGTPFYSG
ncbi:MAG TPA: hypothetical protein VED63_03035, partial [Acidimicrobiales bacterium]|nr:hypothetical protein [Acidimicrobiales bacterium]